MFRATKVCVTQTCDPLRPGRANLFAPVPCFASLLPRCGVTRGDRWSPTLGAKAGAGLWLERPILFQKPNGQRMNSTDAPRLVGSWEKGGWRRGKSETRKSKLEIGK